MTKEPNRPDDADTGGRATPPYEGRRKAAGRGDGEKPAKGGARTGGATGPVEDPDMKSADPEATEKGATRSPADERPADRAKKPRTGDDKGTGPSHLRGTPRAEDQT
ncbi:hypothetical protein ACIBBB_07835 [Streptomyces sp. NPDC051217]|uniref:hypothetical protein n=1 Tax=Streptomyces sp. NPDC051217 TaxID=3365644 RepID=UPI00379D7ECF